MVCRQVADGGDALQVWTVAAKVEIAIAKLKGINRQVMIKFQQTDSTRR
jgi:hypothetical protein